MLVTEMFFNKDICGSYTQSVAETDMSTNEASRPKFCWLQSATSCENCPLNLTEGQEVFVPNLITAQLELSYSLLEPFLVLQQCKLLISN